MKSRNEQIDETYERPNVHIGYDQILAPHHVKIGELVEKYAADADSALDAGCGLGEILSEIKKRNPSIKLYAADIDEKVLAITNERVDVEQSYKIDSVDDLFEMDIAYDVIVMSHVLEHTLRPLDVVKGLVRMLKPDGILILAVPNPARLGVFIGNIFKTHYANRGHAYAWDRSHWINFLENIAEVDVLCYSEDMIPLPLRARLSFLIGPIEKMLARIFPWLAFSHIAVIKAPGNADDRSTSSLSKSEST